jgi:ribosome-associated protein
MALLPVDDRLALPEEELSFLTSRSGGPGGQNVNKVETRVTVRFDLASPSLADDQRARLRERLATRITRGGVLHVTAQRHRTQAANREAAIARLLELLREALAEAVPRRATRVSRAARTRRLQAKRRRGERKRTRVPPRLDE